MASDPVSALDVALASLTAFEDRFEHVEVVTALLDQQYEPAGELEDVVSVGFRIRGRPGIFSVYPPLSVNWQAQAHVLIGAKHAMIEGIYAGLPSKDALPPGSLDSPPIPRATAVPA